MTKTKPRVEMVRIDNLRFDPQVQRSLDHHWVDRLAREWDDEKAGIIKVSRREDGDYVTDGQHRIAALRQRGKGETLLPALVQQHLDRRREAKDFVATNAEGRRPHPVDVYRVQLVAGDPKTVAIEAVLAERGLKVMLDTKLPNAITAVAALRWIYDQGGERLLADVLDICTSAWGNQEPARFQTSILKGLAIVLNRKGREVNREELATKLSRDVTPGRLVGKSRALASAWAKSLPNSSAEVIVGIYNRGKHSRRISL